MIPPPPGFPNLTHHPAPAQSEGNSFDKLAEVMEKDIKRKEKRDTKLKNKKWSKFADVQKDTILLASMGQYFIKPTEPTEFMKKMIVSETGIQAREWIHTYLDNNIIDADKGMCTSLL